MIKSRYHDIWRLSRKYWKNLRLAHLGRGRVKISKLKLSGKNRVVNRFTSVAKIITSDAGRCDIRETRVRFGVE